MKERHNTFLNLPGVLALSVFFIGSSSLSAQIIILRETFSVFFGNELILGIVLANWLVFGAIGSWVAGRTVDRLKSPVPVYIVFQLSIALIMPVTFTAIRLINGFYLGPGEITGPANTFFVSMAVIGPFCMLTGYCFSLGCRILSEYTGSVRGINLIYVYETLGAGLSGLATSLFLIRSLNPLSVLFLLGSFNTLAALLLSIRTYAGRKWIYSTGLISAMYLIFTITGGTKLLDSASLRARWKDLGFIASENSIYGNLAFIENNGEYSLFENGLLIFNTGDRLAAENIVHFAMLCHENPQKILLISGGIGGDIEEVLKYDVSRLDYIEIDRKIFDFAEKHLPEKQISVLKDPRVRIHHIDGRYYLNKSEDRYDVIITDMPNPSTILLNRFYTLEFFRKIRSSLMDGGVFTFSISGTDNYISPEFQKLLYCIKETASEVFAELVLIPGETIVFLGANRKGILEEDPSFFIERMEQRGIHNRFVSRHFLHDRLNSDKRIFLKQLLEKDRKIRKNTDFSPVAYIYDIIFWSTRFPGRARDILGHLSSRNSFILLALLTILAVIYGLTGNRERLPCLAIGITGFSEILFQIVTVVLFQVLFGYIYYKIGIILTTFMIGLAIGSYLASRLMDNDHILGWFLACQTVLGVYSLALALIIPFLSGIDGPILEKFILILPIFAGGLGGAHFMLGSIILLGENRRSGRSSGILYGADLIGSCLGAVAVTLVMVPSLGLAGTCLLCASLIFVVLTILILRY